MKKNINIRNLIIVMLCITIILMGIGFVFLASRLELISNEKSTTSVEITKVEVGTAIKGGTIEPTAIKELLDEGHTVKFNFTLNSPKDELAYEITIKNTGNSPVKIIRLISSPDYINDSKQKSLIDPVTITHTNISNKVLEPYQTVKVKLLVTYNMSNTIKQINIPYQLTILATSKN